MAVIGWFLFGLFLLGGIFFTVQMPEIWIGQIWIGVALLLVALSLLSKRAAARAAALRRDGIAGRADVLSATETGAYVNNQPRVRLTLRISAPGVDPFDVEETYTVPHTALGALGSGRPLPVHIDRDDHAVFAIDLAGDGSPTPPGPAEQAAGSAERIRELGELKAAQLITDEEYRAQRARILSTI